MTPAPRWPFRLFRIASLVVPSAVAWRVAFSMPNPSGLTSAITLALGPLWLLVAAAIAVRSVEALVRRTKANKDDQAGGGASPTEPSLLASIDVLTDTGTSMAWLSAFAIVCSVWVGWASLAAVGLLGTCLLHFVVLAAFVAVRGDDPFRRASVSRRFVPQIVSEGDAVVEELRFEEVRIPTGFRLFATGRVAPRWATSRYVLDATESGGEVVLESSVGPAFRGEHTAEPLEVWLQDIFGLCCSVRVPVGAAAVSVLPRPHAAECATPLLDRGASAREARPASRLPTEGSFRLREYQPGDDVRRIHWVRSQASRELVVRLPDELPPDRRRVFVVLDTYFREAKGLRCDAPHELLDSLVVLWLGVARALVEKGARVTLVTTSSHGGTVTPVAQELTLRGHGPELRLGAQVAWQDQLPAEALVAPGETIVVSRGLLPAAGEPDRGVRWVVLPAPSVIAHHPKLERWEFASPLRLAYPVGSPENRQDGDRLAKVGHIRQHHAVFMRLCGELAPAPRGSFVAVPSGNAAFRLEAVA